MPPQMMLLLIDMSKQLCWQKWNQNEKKKIYYAHFSNRNSLHGLTITVDVSLYLHNTQH